MKTEEDEAFDEIARKQGHWGGGFPAKRAMAADKLYYSTEARWCKNFVEVKHPHIENEIVRFYFTQPAQPAQEPVGEQFKFWSVTGKYERQAFASLASAEAYCKGLNTTHPEGNYVVRPLQEITEACTDERMCVPCYTGQGACESTPSLQPQPAQEPFGWYSAQEDEFMKNKIRKEHERLNSYTHINGKFDLPLFTTPPKREWVGLTLDEIEELFQSAAGADEETDIRFARLIEAKLKKKNT